MRAFGVDLGIHPAIFVMRGVPLSWRDAFLRFLRPESGPLCERRI